ncbi:MAG: hypothetical protein ILP02_04220 [Clostridia bacterium]|nr:hypothetical protein [Clostridia bacterium]
MKDIRYVELFGVYKKALTLLQADITELYYVYDLSLSEIAEIKSVTRQSVADALKKSRQELDDLEQKLGFVKKKHALTAFADTLSEDKKNELTGLLED